MNTIERKAPPVPLPPVQKPPYPRRQSRASTTMPPQWRRVRRGRQGERNVLNEQPERPRRTSAFLQTFSANRLRARGERTLIGANSR